MKIIAQSIKTTLIGGVIFLVPLAVIAAIAGKVFQVIGKVAIVISDILPFKTISGIAVVNLVGLVLIVMLCFFAGHLARSRIGKKISASVESKMYALVPRYAFIKSMTAALSDNCQDQNLLKPIWVKFDDYSQIAFEVNRDAQDMVTIYLPGAPDPWSGSIVHVDPDRVEPLDAEFSAVIKSLRKVGIDTDKFRKS
ncbi:MAG: DUF502 domain-containing protein [Planctomycetes bacterium]|nr:DUF502 domain-containing protein [Planctomycetota bacterium]